LFSSIRARRALSTRRRSAIAASGVERGLGGDRGTFGADDRRHLLADQIGDAAVSQPTLDLLPRHRPPLTLLSTCFRLSFANWINSLSGSCCTSRSGSISLAHLVQRPQQHFEHAGPQHGARIALRELLPHLLRQLPGAAGQPEHLLDELALRREVAASEKPGLKLGRQARLGFCLSPRSATRVGRLRGVENASCGLSIHDSSSATTMSSNGVGVNVAMILAIGTIFLRKDFTFSGSKPAAGIATFTSVSSG
jgi:hypothetical protein